MSRYQSAPGLPGAMPTPDWFRALLAGINGPLGAVLDVGSAEGVMSMMAADAGATSVLGIGLTDDRMTTAREAAVSYPTVTFREMYAADHDEPADTIIYSMMAHWLGPDETARFARLARRWFAVIFRTANDHYAIPENGTWFPTIEEMDATVGGIRTSETHLLTQDRGKEVWAATYRMDFALRDGWVYKPIADTQGLAAMLEAGAPFRAQYGIGWYATRYVDGFDLHGDPPFRPRHPGQPVLSGMDVEALASATARAALLSGWYPTDFSPRNIIRSRDGCELVDLDEIEQHDGHVGDRYLSIWQSVLPGFTGDFRELV